MFKFWVCMTLGMEVGVLFAVLPTNLGLVLTAACAYMLFLEVYRRLG
jgi:hypothetical protein